MPTLLAVVVGLFVVAVSNVLGIEAGLGLVAFGLADVALDKYRAKKVTN